MSNRNYERQMSIQVILIIINTIIEIVLKFNCFTKKSIMKKMTLIKIISMKSLSRLILENFYSMVTIIPYKLHRPWSSIAFKV